MNRAGCNLNTEEFGRALFNAGFRRFAGVPCSFLSPLINYAINEGRFFMANNEGDAVAIASGMSLGGEIGVALMQNSGLTNAISPLTSLNFTFKLPILGFVSLRGEEGLNDEPQHKLMGQITDKLLDICRIKCSVLSNDIIKATKQINDVKEAINKGETYFFIVKKHTFTPLKLRQKMIDNESKVARKDIINVISKCLKNSILVASTGYISRELYGIEDEGKHNNESRNFYMVGSMGCASSIALGLSLTTKAKVVAIEGDGAAIMRMGNMLANAHYTKEANKANFCHIVLDNHMHESTGGQESLSKTCNFPDIARALDYEFIYSPKSIESLEKCLNEFNDRCHGGATFIYFKIKESGGNLGRPKSSPSILKDKLQRYLKHVL